MRGWIKAHGGNSWDNCSTNCGTVVPTVISLPQRPDQGENPSHSSVHWPSAQLVDARPQRIETITQRIEMARKRQLHGTSQLGFFLCAPRASVVQLRLFHSPRGHAMRQIDGARELPQHPPAKAQPEQSSLALEQRRPPQTR